MRRRKSASFSAIWRLSVSSAKPGGRRARQRVRTAKGRSVSSTRWLERQLNDPYVAGARAAGYRSRAAWKLAEIDDRFHLLRPGASVVDLGAAPGGWTQIACERVGRHGRVIACDRVEMAPVAGATFVRGDFLDAEGSAAVRAALGGRADAVLSDMAAPATGTGADALRVAALCEAAFEFALDALDSGGGFVAKVLQGGGESGLLAKMKRAFREVRHVKPPASRAESRELYLVARGFHGKR